MRLDETYGISDAFWIISFVSFSTSGSRPSHTTSLFFLYVSDHGIQMEGDNGKRITILWSLSLYFPSPFRTDLPSVGPMERRW